MNSFKWMLFLLLNLVYFPFIVEATSPNEECLKINIFSSPSSLGLEITPIILKNALVALGHEVEIKNRDEQRKEKDPSVDINIFVEGINIPWLSNATANWFIPNPESCTQDIVLLDCIDLILCRTHEVERIFQSLNKKTYFLSFSSRDCELKTVNKDFSSYIHVGGSSGFKGTDAVIEAWSKHIELPSLILATHLNRKPLSQENVEWIGNRLSVDKLHFLQNSCGIHLCPSDTEGYGHYIMEAMSTGAVVITTDAPPMNEYITDKRFLVPYRVQTKCQLATRYFVGPDELRNTIENLMQLSSEELQQIGANNRRTYLKKTEDYYENLTKLIADFLRLRNSNHDQETNLKRKQIEKAFSEKKFSDENNSKSWNANSLASSSPLPTNSQFNALKTSVLDYLSNSWVTKEKATLIMEVVALTKPQVCVDVGSFVGSSALPMAATLQYLKQGKVYLIDAWSNKAAVKHMPVHDANYRWWSKQDMKKTKKKCMQMLKTWALNPYCKVLHKASKNAVKKIGAIDFLHLDGNTTKEGSLLDATLYVPKVNAHGYILLSNALTTVNYTCSKIATLEYLYQCCDLIAEIEGGNALLFKKR